MRKNYLKLFLGSIFILWIIYFIQTYFYIQEPFTHRIHSFYRPYVRQFNQTYESFINNYGSNVIINKLKKWNIY